MVIMATGSALVPPGKPRHTKPLKDKKKRKDVQKGRKKK